MGGVTRFDACQFAVSGQYGVFWTSKDGRRLRQSPHCERESVLTVLDLDGEEMEENERGLFALEAYHEELLRKGIARFLNVRFDEGFAVSGRLLVLCQTKKRELILHQFVNRNE